ncbi:jg20687, partial [Pararge aegeria aegeria]
CQPPAKKPAPTIRVDGGFKWNLQALAKAADAVGSGGKSPVSALNELGLKVHYSITKQEGPAHCPNFNVTVTFRTQGGNSMLHKERRELSQTVSHETETVEILRVTEIADSDLKWKHPICILNEYCTTRITFNELGRSEDPGLHLGQGGLKTIILAKYRLVDFICL